MNDKEDKTIHPIDADFYSVVKSAAYSPDQNPNKNNKIAIKIGVLSPPPYQESLFYVEKQIEKQVKKWLVKYIVPFKLVRSNT